MGVKIKKIAIANRGEIAVRVIATCYEMGIVPVLLYSSADEGSLAFRLSTERVCIGPGDPVKSYLSVSAIIEGALRAGVQALHPGYGFLSERADLARALRDRGIIFIGPSPEALSIFGDKLKARQWAVRCGLPVLPAYKVTDKGLVVSESKDVTPAGVTSGGITPGSTAPGVGVKDIGFKKLLSDKAWMIKALHGGGGRGLRVVRKVEEWEAALGAARREALSAFRSSEVFLEQYLPYARHVEVQVFASGRGEVSYLFDRDCSIQRRRAKVIEEAPAGYVPLKVREQMKSAALALFSDVGWTQAGTVEFLYQDGRFYFLEVNPRIQVECPVTEMVLGVDLVRAQILVAQGEDPWVGRVFEPRGHSIQCRIYAEDVAKRVPVFGRLGSCYFPQGFFGRRFDMGYDSGDRVPSFYDTLLGKVITYGDTREQARQKMLSVLRQTIVFGLKTNISFLQDVLAHKKFIKGDVHTRFIEEEFLDQWKDKALSPLDPAVLSAVQSFVKPPATKPDVVKSGAFNPWMHFGSANEHLQE